MEPLSPSEADQARTLIGLALGEDLGTAGDLTSRALIPADLPGKAALVSRREGVVAGLALLQVITGMAAPDVTVTPAANDGDRVTAGTELATLAGPMGRILTIERTALNFLQRLSGVATLTSRYVDAIAGTTARILDTRKTTPGWRLLEKYAVRCGGGTNHRVGLYDAVMIKDNHLAALGGGADAIAEAVRRSRATGVPVILEVDDLDQFAHALKAGPDVVLLDNMPPEQLREAVRLRNAAAPGIELEASGGVNLDTVRGIAETGVDRISVGAITHSAVALDIGLDYRE